MKLRNTRPFYLKADKCTNASIREKRKTAHIKGIWVRRENGNFVWVKGFDFGLGEEDCTRNGGLTMSTSSIEIGR